MSTPSTLPPPASSPSPVSLRLTALVDDVLAGREEAWGELWTAALPIIQAVAGCRRWASRLARSADEHDSVTIEVMGRLAANGFERLARFRDRLRDDPTRSVRKWLGAVTRNVVVNHIHSHPQYLGPGEEGQSRRWAVETSLDAAGGMPAQQDHDPFDRIDAHRIADLLGATLTETQRRAIALRLADVCDEKIAAALGFADAGRADREVRAAIKRLRRAARGWAEADGAGAEENRPVRVPDRRQELSSIHQRARDQRTPRPPRPPR